jgi:hypothetical protein
MNCKDFHELIPAFIKRELEGEKRILTKTHLKACVDCQEEYLSQEKIYYTLDREEILLPDPEISKGFKTEVLDRINQSSKRKKQINKKWIWYAVAATLLMGIIIGRFVIPDGGGQEYITEKYDETLSQLIASEDWNRLEIVLSDQNEFSKYSTDTIAIHILLEKLSALQKMGIQSLPLFHPSNPDRLKKFATISNDPQIQISLNDFISLLEEARQQRSQITLEEVSNLLTKI